MAREHESRKYTPQRRRRGVSSEQGGLRAAPVAQEHRYLGLDGCTNVHCTGGARGGDLVVLRLLVIDCACESNQLY
jgi:hypothetical protein